MARNEFEGEVGKFLKAKFPIAERLDDVAFNRESGRQVSKKPWDFYGASWRGKFWAAEAKRVKSPRFPVDSFRPHQHESLARLEGLGVYAWVFINWRIGESRDTGIAIWVPYSLYMETEKEVTDDGRRSIKATDFTEYWRLSRVTGGWDVPKEHAFFIVSEKPENGDNGNHLRVG